MTDLLANPAFRLFAICYLVLALKMMALGAYTSVLRIRRRVYATSEDYRLQGVEPKGRSDEDIERARRAHRNDLENILPFLGVGLVYALTNPTAVAAAVTLIGFTAARVLHTVFYVLSLQPHRTIAFTIGFVLELWMVLAALFSLAAA
jgi:uncharacterized MAPEG superfamily protein